MVNAGTLWRTLRHLRARQVRGQIVHRLRQRLTNPARFKPGDAGRPPTVRGFIQAPPSPAGTPFSREELTAGRFRFVGEEQITGWPPEWSPDGPAKLWLYNLHYFEWLDALDDTQAKAACEHWIETYTPARNRDGWEPYPLSLRTMNWIAHFYGRRPQALEGDPAFAELLWRSLHRQLEWLRRRMEYHLCGNHLLENAAALTLAGGVFEGDTAERWRRTGFELLQREIEEQLPDDGLHFERSPMYHQRVLYLLLVLSSVDDVSLRTLGVPVLMRALEAMACVCHPDGDIALLNDAAFGIYPHPARLFEGARSLGIEVGPAADGSFALRDAGYYGFRRRGDYVICDAGEIGPDYIPGHAHGDLFSFELSLGGHRVVVDAGVHDYVTGSMRDYCRSTAAHNTVEIEGRDQSEFWSAFRVGRRAQPQDVDWAPDDDGFTLDAWHDGYSWLDGSPKHRRVFRLHEDGTFEVTDHIDSAKPVRARSRLHLHPECAIDHLGDREARIRHPGGSCVIRFSGRGELSSEPSIHCPRFGTRKEAKGLVLSAEGSHFEFGYRIEHA